MKAQLHPLWVFGNSTLLPPLISPSHPLPLSEAGAGMAALRWAIFLFLVGEVPNGFRDGISGLKGSQPPSWRMLGLESTGLGLVTIRSATSNFTFKYQT